MISLFSQEQHFYIYFLSHLKIYSPFNVALRRQPTTASGVLTFLQTVSFPFLKNVWIWSFLPVPDFLVRVFSYLFIFKNVAQVCCFYLSVLVFFFLLSRNVSYFSFSTSLHCNANYKALHFLCFTFSYPTLGLNRVYNSALGCSLQFLE